jgi:hypothetical protein
VLVGDSGLLPLPPTHCPTRVLVPDSCSFLAALASLSSTCTAFDISPPSDHQQIISHGAPIRQATPDIARGPLQPTPSPYQDSNTGEAPSTQDLKVRTQYESYDTIRGLNHHRLLVDFAEPTRKPSLEYWQFHF